MMELDDKTRAEAYKLVFMGSPMGQLVFWDIMSRCHLFQDQKEFNATAYRMLGRRSIGLEIFQLTEMVPVLSDGLKSEAMAKIHKSLTAASDMIPKPKKEKE